MTENYIKNHFEDIKKFANVVEKRLDDDCEMEDFLEQNRFNLEFAKKYNLNCVLIDENYEIQADLFD